MTTQLERAHAHHLITLTSGIWRAYIAQLRTFIISPSAGHDFVVLALDSLAPSDEDTPNLPGAYDYMRRAIAVNNEWKPMCNAVKELLDYTK